MRIWNKRTDRPPAGAVYVGRPSVWGNPFSVEAYGRDGAVSLHRQWFLDPEQAGLRALAKRELAGKDLVCWCSPLKCHAEILMAVANEGGKR